MCILNRSARRWIVRRTLLFVVTLGLLGVVPCGYADTEESAARGILARVLVALGFAEDNEDEQNADDDDSPNVIARAGEYIDGRAVVRIGTQRAALAGITIEILTEAVSGVQIRASGEVLPPDELLDARDRYRQSLVRTNAARERLTIARSVQSGLRKLSGRAEPPRRRLREAELERSAAAAELEAMSEAAAALRLKTRLRWGNALAQRFFETDDDTAIYDWLSEHAIVIVTLPHATTMPADIRELRLEPATLNGEGRRASVLGPAGMRSPVQGESWLALAAGSRLRPGMRVLVFIGQDADRVGGVAVPISAVVWHYGKPWIYLQHEPGIYLRTAIEQFESRNDSWFVADQSLAGQQVVRTGAQVLLSEESRWNIPEEDDAD